MRAIWKPFVLLAVTAAVLAVDRPAAAGEVDVVGVNVVKSQAGVYRFEVTLSHADEGWSHYADRWQVVDDQGRALGTRVLLHPHVNEQPFTRGKRITLPDGAAPATVTVRAHDKVHGWGGRELVVELPE
ncbi:MAG TPA: hypothetical protein QGF63_02595 [Alphaproteobacteria bacterium]|jgi:hypothetical protein|nr:hypothetical protein [Alphaproteobacteria bacterium]MDP7429821.1 hypothetical protein [Alphaproteobacteria bacterium]HJM48717.1 hypothetical protein [Alphaproteobacteria bacterium]|tara:strand:+ start:314 stop:700 length:387 start_codon:yes stop_codon:yes gene_type:complete